MWLFGSRKTPQEMLRQHQRALTKAIRELDRERVKLEQQEKKLIADIKKSAKQNQIGACKIMAKDLVRTRKYVQKFHQMKAQLQAVSLRIQTMKSTQSMTEAMQGVSKAMRKINQSVNLPQIQKVLMDFERESEMMDMKEEVMSDTVDGIMESDGDEEESDEIVQQILDEIGINLDQTLPNAAQKQTVENSAFKNAEGLEL